MSKGNYFIACNIEQAKALKDALNRAIEVAELAQELEKRDWLGTEDYADYDPEVKIQIEAKKYSTDENACIEYDVQIKY